MWFPGHKQNECHVGPFCGGAEAAMIAEVTVTDRTERLAEADLIRSLYNY